MLLPTHHAPSPLMYTGVRDSPENTLGCGSLSTTSASVNIRLKRRTPLRSTSTLVYMIVYV
eukprot:755327-Pyramimonas_sp.AAC.2